MEEIAARMREGLIGAREESEVRGRKEKNEREESRSTEVTAKKLEVEEPRSKKGKKNENGTRFEEELVAGREAWEETSVDRK